MADIDDCPSPNFGPRKGGLTPSLIVIHYTAMESAQAAIDRLCDPDLEVSAHYVVASTGQMTRLVAEENRAWHAGVGSWYGLDDINSRSIGIELDNRGTHPFAEPQMSALEGLVGDIMARWSIAPAGVIGHSDLAPGRKIDPGPHFDWVRLARQGLAAAVKSPQTPPTCDPDSFLKAARAAGYPENADFDALLHTTRLRTAPWRQGPLCPDDYAFAMT